MKKTLIEFVSIIIVAALVAFLSACNGGAMTENTNGYQSSGMLYVDSIGKIQSRAQGTNLIRVFNESKENFSFKKVELTSLTAKKLQKLDIDIDATSCNTLLAGKSCQLLADFTSLASGSYRLQAIFSDKNGNKLLASQLVEIVADANIANPGIELLGYGGGKVIANNGKYHINLPVMLQNNYESIITSQGKLECNHGFESGAICNWLIDGMVNKENTTLQLSLKGYDKQKRKTAIRYRLNVTNNIQANLLLSEIADIEIGTTSENTQQLVIFNAGNYSAGNIALSVLPENDLELVNNDCDGIVLRPQASCSVGVKARNSNRTGHGMVEATYYINSNGSEGSSNTLVLYYANDVTAAMSLEYLSGDNSDFVVGGESRSLVYRLSNSGQNDVKDISLAVSNGRIATATVAGETSCSIDGKLELAVEKNCVFQANLALNDMKLQSLTAKGTYQDEHNESREIAISDIMMNFLPPEITIDSVSNWQTMVGTPFTFTATITGGRSTVTPTISGMANVRIEPASCTLDSQIPAMQKCAFVVTSTETIAANRYYAWNPATIPNSNDVNNPSTTQTLTGIGLQVAATNNASINDSPNGSYTVSNISGNVFAPYVYLPAPWVGAAVNGNVGITWGSGGSVNPRFSVGRNPSGGACPAGQEILVDNLTGLTWRQQPTTTTYTRANAVAAIPASFCGYTDWRITNIHELTSLISIYGLTTDLRTFLTSMGFGGSLGATYLSVNNVNNEGGQLHVDRNLHTLIGVFTYVPDTAPIFLSNLTTPINVWIVRGNPTGGVNMALIPKTAPGSTAVAGPGKQWPDERFIEDSSGDCLIDKLTGLMWPKNLRIAGKKTWYSEFNTLLTNVVNDTDITQKYHKLCGFNDWRIPNVNELQSLVNFSSLTVSPIENYNFDYLLEQGFYFDGDATRDIYWTVARPTTGGQVYAFSLKIGGMVVYNADVNHPHNRFNALPVRGGR